MSAVATASLFTYLTHFVVYPHVMEVNSGLAVVASLAVGLAYWQVWTRVEALARKAWARLRSAVSASSALGSAARAQTDGRVASA